MFANHSQDSDNCQAGFVKRLALTRIRKHKSSWLTEQKELSEPTTLPAINAILEPIDYGCRMNPDALIAWTSLYIAVGSMALICAVLSVIVTTCELRAAAWRPALRTRLDIALALPKIWLRWQKNYFYGAPVIALIALAFANHIGFEVFWNIEPIG